MEKLGVNDYTSSTRQFLDHMDDFFDCLNVSSKFLGLKKRKQMLLPYEDEHDNRFKWLKETFLGFINGWKRDADNTPNLTKDLKNRRCLSHQTIEGLRITVHSFVELAKELLQIDGIEYLLSDRFNQDPLEEHFGKQRMRGGANDNPTVEEYGYNERRIITAKSGLLTVMRGNTRGAKHNNTPLDINDLQELPKKKKKDD